MRVRNRRSLRRSASSACFRSVMSRAIRDQPDDATGGVAPRRLGGQEDPLPLGSRDDLLDHLLDPGLHDPPVLGVDRLAHGGIREVLPVGPPHDLRGDLPDGAEHGGVREEDAPLPILGEDRVGRRVDDVPEDLAALAQVVLGATPVGDVEHDAHRPARLLVLAARKWRRAHGQHAPRSVRAPQVELELRHLVAGPGRARCGPLLRRDAGHAVGPVDVVRKVRVGRAVLGLSCPRCGHRPRCARPPSRGCPPRTRRRRAPPGARRAPPGWPPPPRGRFRPRSRSGCSPRALQARRLRRGGAWAGCGWPFEPRMVPWKWGGATVHVPPTHGRI